MAEAHRVGGGKEDSEERERERLAAIAAGGGRREEEAVGTDCGIVAVAIAKAGLGAAMEMALGKGSPLGTAARKTLEVVVGVHWIWEGTAFAAEEEIAAAIEQERGLEVGIAMVLVAVAVVAEDQTRREPEIREGPRW